MFYWKMRVNDFYFQTTFEGLVAFNLQASLPKFLKLKSVQANLGKKTEPLLETSLLTSLQPATEI